MGAKAAMNFATSELVFPGGLRKLPAMRLSYLPLIVSLVAVFAAQSAVAAESKFAFKADSSISALLAGQEGSVVELRLTSGDKIGGKVEKVGEKLVHLSNLTGQEFFEAVVDLDEVVAVVVRAKK